MCIFGDQEKRLERVSVWAQRPYLPSVQEPFPQSNPPSAKIGWREILRLKHRQILRKTRKDPVKNRLKVPSFSECPSNHSQKSELPTSKFWQPSMDGRTVLKHIWECHVGIMSRFSGPETILTAIVSPSSTHTSNRCNGERRRSLRNPQRQVEAPG